MDDTLIGNIIFSASAEGLTLVGMNQDNPKTSATFTILPSINGKPGKVIFGSDDEFESGMNEKGLMIGLSPASTIDVEYPADKPTLEGSPWHTILDSCSSVADSLEMLNEYNLVGLESCQAFITDPSGDAAIQRWGEQADQRV